MKDPNDKIKLILVCELKECDKVPLMNIQVGTDYHNFCCQKGFNKAVADFKENVEESERADT